MSTHVSRKRAWDDEIRSSEDGGVLSDEEVVYGA
jgi:hypothetical protein